MMQIQLFRIPHIQYDINLTTPEKSKKKQVQEKFPSVALPSSLSGSGRGL